MDLTEKQGQTDTELYGHQAGKFAPGTMNTRKPRIVQDAGSWCTLTLKSDTTATRK